MLIDYYGIYDKYAFPNWAAAEKLEDKIARMDVIESSMKEDIADTKRHRFIPYMQLHEFEGLLFNNIQVFFDQVPKNELVGLPELRKTFDDYANPEMINNNKTTAPSKRLERIIQGYNKPLYGHYFAEAIGLENIMAKCPRFNNWINQLINI